MNVRGALTIFVLGLAFLVGDVVQRTIIAGSVRLFPRRRIRILSKWQHMWAAACIGSVRHIGGAKIQAPPKFEAGPGTLIVMNHQSVLDIPLAVSALRPTHPRIVTRARYAHGKPLISHMVRLYQYPTVDPRAMTKDDVRTVAKRVAASPVPVVIYPEGTRSRTGNIASFRRAGLSAILAERSWTVHVLTIDGYWSLRTMGDFLAGSSRIRGRMKVSGPWTSPDPADTEVGAGDDTRDDPVIEAFIQTIEQAMRDNLQEIRTEAEPASGVSGG